MSQLPSATLQPIAARIAAAICAADEAQVRSLHAELAKRIAAGAKAAEARHTRAAVARYRSNWHLGAQKRRRSFPLSAARRNTGRIGVCGPISMRSLPGARGGE